MPTYEYLCGSCEGRFEKFQSITAGALVKCPQCGKRKLKRLIGAGAGVIFKGSGFHETDYRSDSYKEAVKKETSKSDGDSGKDKKETAVSESKKTPEKSQTASSTKTSESSGNKAKKEK